MNPTTHVLQALRHLQKDRATPKPFANLLELQKWSDDVLPLLAFDEKLRSAFKHHILNASVSFNMGTFGDAEGSTSNAIGVVNQAAKQLELQLELEAKAKEQERANAQPLRQQQLLPPEKLTFKWLYEHAPWQFYVWLIGALSAAFVAGIGVGSSEFFESLNRPKQNEPSPRSLPIQRQSLPSFAASPPASAPR